MNKDPETAAPGPVTAYQAKFPITLQAGEYDLQTTVMDLSSGAVVPDHMHGGSVFGVVLSGEMTLREKGSERIVKTGESWTESSSHVHSAVNTGVAPARIVVSVLMPKGAEATTIIKR